MVALASTLGVSVDWLLGLVDEGPYRAELLPEEPSFTDELSPNDALLLGWLHAANGMRVRYVPATLPDLIKTDDVIRHETVHFDAANPEQRIETSAVRLDWQRGPQSDLEACNSVQALEGFAQGEGVWKALSAPRRRAQLAQAIDLVDELYPTFRWFLYDGRQRYAAPITIFGNQRCVLYIGQMYLIVTRSDQVRALTKNFDQLIRNAVVQPPDLPKLLKRLHDSVS